jgi:hypothetical protein
MAIALFAKAQSQVFIAGSLINLIPSQIRPFKQKNNRPGSHQVTKGNIFHVFLGALVAE